MIECADKECLQMYSSPISPAHMDWSVHFPAFVDPDPSHTNLSGARKLMKDVEIADIGCGFGGLLVALAPLMPDTLMIGECGDILISYVLSIPGYLLIDILWRPIADDH